MLNDPEEQSEDDDDDYEAPEYMSQPLMHKYVGQLFMLVDRLYAETNDSVQSPEVEMLKDTLMTIKRRIIYDGELQELDDILRMHFPWMYHGYDGEKDVREDLLKYPLSQEN